MGSPAKLAAAVRIHLGHHFYGAGNLGDDFMLAGFLSALRRHVNEVELSCCVPFELAPLRQRFGGIEWLPYQAAARERSIAKCDAWLGIGGSPFQSAQSRWFVDHLIEDAALCRGAAKLMYFLGVGTQTVAELQLPEIQQLCRQAAYIWTRDTASAERLRSLGTDTPVTAATDLAHILFSQSPPPPATAGRATLVVNFDFAGWPAQTVCLAALDRLGATEHVWLAQESRELPGAERALHATLPSADMARWHLVSPEVAGAPLTDVLARWPSGEWLVTSRFHAAIAGAWAGSKVVVIGTNEKLRGVAAELGFPLIATDADVAEVERALTAARPVSPTTLQDAAARAARACDEFVRLSVDPQLRTRAEVS